MKKYLTPFLFLAGLAFFFRQGLPFGLTVAWIVAISLTMLAKQEFKEYVNAMDLSAIKMIDLIFLATAFALGVGSAIILSSRPADFRSFWLNSLAGFMFGWFIYLAALSLQLYQAYLDRFKGEKGGKERN